MTAASITRFIPGLALLVAIAAAPLMALPAQSDDGGRFVGSEMQKSSGAGLVIMVSLQRAN